MRLDYPFDIIKEEDDTAYSVQFIDIEEAFTQGNTIEECYKYAEEVLSAMLEMRLETNDEIPEPSEGDYPHRVAPDVGIQASILIKKAMESKVFTELQNSLKALGKHLVLKAD